MSILVMFMGLVMFALVALVWNTGEVTTAKIEAQTAADSAAYSSAVWTSRALNITAATNVQIMRDGSAAAVATSMHGQAIFYFTQAGVKVILDLNDFVNAANAFGAAANPIGLASGAFAAASAALAVAIVNLVQSINDFILASEIINDLGGFVQPINDILALTDHLQTLGAYQRIWLERVPSLIEAQRVALERYYDCDISLSHPFGHELDSAPGPVGTAQGKIRPPLRIGRASDIFTPLALCFLYDLYGRAGSNEGWYHDKRLREFKRIPVKPLPVAFHAAAATAFTFILLGVVNDNFHTLTTAESFGPFPGLEYGPYGGLLAPGPRWADYTVLAVASKRTSNDESLQMPSRPLGLMARNVFGDPEEVRPVAYATAETFNGIDGFLGSIGGDFKPAQEFFAFLPWRMWTDWGWQWSARMSHSEALFGGEAAAAFGAQGYDVTTSELWKAAVH